MSNQFNIRSTLNKYSPFLFVGLLMVLVGVISTKFLINNSIRLDESQSLWQTSRSLGKVFEIIAEDVHVPLYHTILHIWQAFLGSDVVLARLLSLILFIATIPVVYLLAYYAYNKKGVALFASLLISISPFLNWYANEVRMYSLLTFVVVVNQYFFLRIYKKGNKWAYLGYLISACIGVYTHYFFSVYLFISALFFLVFRKRFPKKAFKRLLIILITIGLFFLPWIIFVFQQGSASNTRPLLIKPSSVDFFNALAQYIIGFQNDTINTLVISLWPTVVILLFLILRRNIKAHNTETAFFVTTAFAPIILIFVFSLLIQPFFTSRYLAYSIPSLYILFAYLLTLYGKKLRIVLGIVLIALMIGGFTTQLKSEDSPVVEDYKEAVDYINSNIKYQDVFVISAPFTIYPVEYYYTGETPINTLPIWDRTKFGQIPPFSTEKLPEEANKLTNNKYRLWLLLSYNQGFEEEVRLYFDKKYQKLEFKNFSKGLSLHVYQLSYDYPL